MTVATWLIRVPQLLTEGTIVDGRYVLEAQIGDGAMGLVYRAHHAKVSRRFAIKVLHHSLMADPKVVKRFAREAELAGRLRHTNVVSVVDVGRTDNGMHYLAMELAPGVSLASILDEGGPLSESRMLDVTKQLCAGLAHAHDVGLIHRDLKPENVIVDQQAGGREIARIVDFGVAILREDGESHDVHRLTTKGIAIGTPHYMAPEQACAGAMDHRVDIFALGLMCYEMLTGHLPFAGTGADIARAIVHETIPSMQDRAPDITVDPALEAIVMAMLTKDPADRPESAHVVREMLEAYERRDVRATAAVEPMVVNKTAKFLRAAKPGRSLWVAAVIGAMVAWCASPLPTPSAAPAVVEISHDEEPFAAIAMERAHESLPPVPGPLHILELPRQTAQQRPAASPQPIAAANATEVAKLYAQVGRDLKVFERENGMEATIDYWPRYRWIRINEAIATPEKRNETFRMLARLRSDLNSRGQ